MARFEIEAIGDNASPPRTIEAENWMMAVADAMEALGYDADAMARVVCDIDMTGLVHVQAPATGGEIMVRPLDEDESGELTSLGLDGVDAMDAPPPNISPAFSSREHGEDDLDQIIQLLAILDEIDSVGGACTRALDILLRHVPAESASVLRHDPEEKVLYFVDARGPRSEMLVGVRIPEDAGIAGVARRSGTAMLVREAATAPHHYGAMDAATGYHTRNLLAVPLRSRGRVYGVLELLNHFAGGDFMEWHQDAASVVGERLARRIARG